MLKWILPELERLPCEPEVKKTAAFSWQYINASKKGKDMFSYPEWRGIPKISRGDNSTGTGMWWEIKNRYWGKCWEWIYQGKGREDDRKQDGKTYANETLKSTGLRAGKETDSAMWWSKICSHTIIIRIRHRLWWRTHRDWSRISDRKVWASSLRRTSVEHAHATCVKHSAQAFLTPHTPSSHRKQNLGSWHTKQKQYFHISFLNLVHPDEQIFLKSSQIYF